MPKTYTDDIAAALPTSLAGPFLVADPNDSSSWIKLDPADAAIAVAGGARPTRVLPATFARSHLSGGSALIGSVMAARSVSDGLTGGFLTVPLRIPEDMDLSEPADVTVLVNPGQNATTNGQVVRFEFSYSHVASSGQVTNGVLILDWNVPNNWTVNDHAFVVIDNGNGRTFEADVFGAGSFVGFRCVRLGAAAQDTFNKSINIAETMGFRYRAKRF